MTIFPYNYKPFISEPIENEKAIKLVRDKFVEALFEDDLQLLRTSCPLFINTDNGVNDDLCGQSNPISFNINKHNINAEIVQSLAKWKRIKCKQLNLLPLSGIYTNMNAIRNNEEIDNLHSIYVDQWDWEMVIDNDHRTYEFLSTIVKSIYSAILRTEYIVNKIYPQLQRFLPEDIKIISTKELEYLYPGRTQTEREYLITSKYRAVFITEMDGFYNRASDYDDWALNGDMLIWSDIINRPIEITSMGIRVNRDALIDQLKRSDEEYKQNLQYHKMILNDELPLTIGGGIGQSRLCMLLLQKAHIGEVQSSVWDKQTIEEFEKYNLKPL